jgi:hypothetical protein
VEIVLLSITLCLLSWGQGFCSYYCNMAYGTSVILLSAYCFEPIIPYHCTQNCFNSSCRVLSNFEILCLKGLHPINSSSRVCLGGPVVTQLDEKLSTFMVTEVIYCVRSPQLAAVLSQMQLFHTLQPSFLRSILILFSYLHPGFPSSFFHFGCPTKIFIHF